MFKEETSTPGRLLKGRRVRAVANVSLGLAVALGLASCAGGSSATNTIKVSAIAPPDIAPVGVADFGEEAAQQFEDWKTEKDANVNFDVVSYEQLHAKLSTAFAADSGISDVIFTSGWIPEFTPYFVPLDDYLTQEMIDDFPESSQNAMKWDGKWQAAPATLSISLMYYNEEHLAEAGLSGPPETWDEFKDYVEKLNNGDHYGWVGGFGDVAGIAGVGTMYMSFLQQAGGTMFDEEGNPAFDTPEGVAAMQMMVDLQELGGDPGNISYVGISDAAEVFKSGKASIMFHWPYLWADANNPDSSAIAGKVGIATLPAGPAGTASVDGSDAWSISKASENPELAWELIELWLSPEQQKAQVLETGWLPSRMSVMEDPEVQAAAPHVKVALEQAKHPFNSFVRPHHQEYTHALGTAVQSALSGSKTAEQAVADASAAIQEIVG